MDTTSTIATNAEHEVLSAAADVPMPAVVGAIAGLVVGKSLGWAAAGGAAGYLYAKRGGAVGCPECYGILPSNLLRVGPVRPGNVISTVPVRTPSADPAPDPAPVPESKSALPWALAVGAAWLIFG